MESSLCQEACKLGSSLMKLKEEHDATKASYQMLQEEHQKLKKQHAEDNGERSLEATNIWSYVILVSNLFRLADAAKKPLMPKSRKMVTLSRR